MHIFDQLKSLFGVETRPPFISEQYAQIPEGKYVAWHMDVNPMDQYPYVSIVPKMLKVPIVIFGNGVAETSHRKSAFVAKHASVLVASDLMGSILASTYNVPTVALFGNRPPETTEPYIKPKFYESVFSGKATYGRDGTAGIKSIMPETVANAILRLLGERQRVTSTTIFVGDRFCGDRALFLYPSKAGAIKRRIKSCIMLFDNAISAENLDIAANACDSFFLNINGKLPDGFLARNAKKIVGVEIVCDNTPFSVARDLNMLGKKFSAMCIDSASPNILDYVDHKVTKLEPLPHCVGAFYGSSGDFFDGERVYPSLPALKEGLEKTNPMNIMGHDTYPDFFRFKHFFYIARGGNAS